MSDDEIISNVRFDVFLVFICHYFFTFFIFYLLSRCAKSCEMVQRCHTDLVKHEKLDKLWHENVIAMKR